MDTKGLTQMFRCPVCNCEALSAKPYKTWPPPSDIDLAPPYELQLGPASYEVCPRCGFEFGNDDNPGTAPPLSWESYRQDWVARGRPWLSERAKRRVGDRCS